MSKLPQEKEKKGNNNHKKISAADFAANWNYNPHMNLSRSDDYSQDEIKAKISQLKNENVNHNERFGNESNMDDVPSCFLVLGFNDYPTENELKKRYRELVKQFHPDKDGGDTDKFEEINKAYTDAKRYF